MTYSIKLQYPSKEDGSKYEVEDVTEDFPESFNPHPGSDIYYYLDQYTVEKVNYKVVAGHRTTIVECRKWFLR